MTLELDGKFVIAMWMIPLECPKDMHGRTYPSGDWLATLYKEEGKADCGCHMRFRYHVDDKAHDSDDVKSEMVGTFIGKTEAEAMTTVSLIAETIAKTAKKRPEIHKLLIHSADPEVIVKRLSAEEFFHMKSLAADEKKTNP